MQCDLRPFSTSSTPRADFTHVVVGAGAVGLAIARKLADRDGTSTLLIERHDCFCSIDRKSARLYGSFRLI